MNTYTAGQVVQLTATFTTIATGAPIDPTAITFAYAVAQLPGRDGATTVLTYTGGSSPAVGQVVRTGTGVYVAQVDTTALAGTWTYEWVSTGTGQSAGTSTFLVTALPLTA